MPCLGPVSAGGVPPVLQCPTSSQAVYQPGACLPQAQLTHGYARLHVNATHFHVEAVDSSGKVFDEALMTKGRRSGSGSTQRPFGQRVAARDGLSRAHAPAVRVVS